MQTLKPEILKGIQRAALNEFFDKGFQNSSVRRIASAAGTTAGNLYRYFPGKLELFSSLIEPAYRELNRFSLEHYSAHDDLNLINLPSLLETQFEDFSGIIACYRKEIYILFKKSAGTPYYQKSRTYTAEMTEHALEHFNEINLSGLKSSLYRPLVEAMVKAYLEGWLHFVSIPMAQDDIKNITGSYIKMYLFGPLSAFQKTIKT